MVMGTTNTGATIQKPSQSVGMLILYWTQNIQRISNETTK